MFFESSYKKKFESGNVIDPMNRKTRDSEHDVRVRMINDSSVAFTFQYSLLIASTRVHSRDTIHLCVRFDSGQVMLHEIVIQLDKDVATELRLQPTDYKCAKQVVGLAAELGIELIPQDPESTGESSSFFSILVPSAQSARPIAERFETCAGVNAVYVKPQGEPPG